MFSAAIPPKLGTPVTPARERTIQAGGKDRRRRDAPGLVRGGQHREHGHRQRADTGHRKSQRLRPPPAPARLQREGQSENDQPGPDQHDDQRARNEVGVGPVGKRGNREWRRHADGVILVGGDDHEAGRTVAQAPRANECRRPGVHDAHAGNDDSPPARFARQEHAAPLGVRGVTVIGNRQVIGQFEWPAFQPPGGAAGLRRP